MTQSSNTGDNAFGLVYIHVAHFDFEGHCQAIRTFWLLKLDQDRIAGFLSDLHAVKVDIVGHFEPLRSITVEEIRAALILGEARIKLEVDKVD